MITYSIETLYHFNCSECGGWWSIGDAPDKLTWLCPHCSHKSETQLHSTATTLEWLSELRRFQQNWVSRLIF